MFDSSVKILIVDDMLTIRKIVKKALMELKYKNILEAVDGSDAWDIIQKHGDIQLIISDWNMPNLTGIDLLQKVRQSSEFNKMPFILLTAEADVAQVKQAVDAGVDNYLVKPFSADGLRQKIEQTYSKVKSRIAA